MNNQTTIDKLKDKTLKATSMTPATRVTIKPPNFAHATIKIRGTAPYVQNMFSKENENKMKEKQALGSEPGKKKRQNKPPKDFNKIYLGSLHKSTNGWFGIPCSAIRNSMIDACRVTDFDMVRAKMCIFVEPDGRDAANSEGLIKLSSKPRRYDARVKIGMNQTDIVARGMFDEWTAMVHLKWDADVFTASDIVNLLARAGMQVGIGAGRPLSKTSAGIGFGTFEVIQQ